MLSLVPSLGDQKSGGNETAINRTRVISLYIDTVFFMLFWIIPSIYNILSKCYIVFKD